MRIGRGGEGGRNGGMEERGGGGMEGWERAFLADREGARGDSWQIEREGTRLMGF